MAETSLLAFQHSQGGKDAITVRTEKVDNKTAALSVCSVKVHKELKISGQIYSKSGISYTSLIRQIEAGLKKGILRG